MTKLSFGVIYISGAAFDSFPFRYYAERIVFYASISGTSYKCIKNLGSKNDGVPLSCLILIAYYEEQYQFFYWIPSNFVTKHIINLLIINSQTSFSPKMLELYT